MALKLGEHVVPSIEKKARKSDRLRVMRRARVQYDRRSSSTFPQPTGEPGMTHVNMLADILDRFSIGRPWREANRGLASHLVRRAARLNPLVTADPARYRRIADALAFPDGSRRSWRDPEIYHPIFTLADAGADPTTTERLMTRLEVQIGLKPVADLARLPDGVYRLTAVTGRAYRVASGSATEIATTGVASIDAWPGLIYLPRPELFADLLPPQYRSVPADPAGDAALIDKLTSALRLLRRIAPTLADDVAELVAAIVLLPDEDREPTADPMRLRWSFNIRLSYFGAIFLNLYPVDVYGTLEGLVHEYYHQRLWQWWELERPSGIPDPATTIVSPVTGLERSAAVMTQALLIYVGMHSLFRALEAHGDVWPGASTDWLAARIVHLGAHVPTLHATLRRIIPDDTTLARALDMTMEYFYSAGPSAAVAVGTA
jgi:hypothetical protein